jgi:hypothetical protein
VDLSRCHSLFQQIIAATYLFAAFWNSGSIHVENHQERTKR